MRLPILLLALVLTGFFSGCNLLQPATPEAEDAFDRAIAQALVQMFPPVQPEVSK